jgi:hypothetical protein
MCGSDVQISVARNTGFRATTNYLILMAHSLLTLSFRFLTD